MKNTIQLLNTAKAIANNILNKAQNDKKDICWKTLDLTIDNQTSHQISETLYSGNAGISLLFLELYQITKEDRYLTIVLKNTTWLLTYCKEHPTNNYAFLTGRMGIAHLLQRIYAVTKQKKYLKEALNIAENCLDFLDQQEKLSEYINGNAGILIALLHLHQISQSETLLSKINHFIKALLEEICVGRLGIYWDRSPQQIRGLCGFSHGVAGMAWVFLELGHYFQNNTFYKIAEQAMAYENHHFDASKNNYPDFRKGIYNTEIFEVHRQQYLADNEAFFTTPSKDMVAWCHGAMGSGLTRLRAYQLLKDKKDLYQKDALNCIQKTIDTVNLLDVHGFTLCHGLGGNADLFLEAYLSFENEEYLQYAYQIAQQIIDHQSKQKLFVSGYSTDKPEECTSLFMGNAGIAYFLLRCYAPKKVSSILAPSLKTVTSQQIDIEVYPFIGISESAFSELLLQKAYPKTVELLKLLNPSILPLKQYSSILLFEKELFTHFPNPPQILSNIFKAEKTIRQMDFSTKSNALLHIQQVLRQQSAKELLADEQAFLRKPLKFDEHCKLLSTDWNWDAPLTSNILTTEESDDFYYLLRPSPNGINRESLNVFGYLILSVFESEKTIEEAIPQVMNSFEVETEEEEGMVRQAVIEQCKQFLLLGILH